MSEREREVSIHPGGHGNSKISHWDILMCFCSWNKTTHNQFTTFTKPLWNTTEEQPWHNTYITHWQPSQNLDKSKPQVDMATIPQACGSLRWCVHDVTWVRLLVLNSDPLKYLYFPVGKPWPLTLRRARATGWQTTNNWNGADSPNARIYIYAGRVEIEAPAVNFFHSNFSESMYSYGEQKSSGFPGIFSETLFTVMWGSRSSRFLILTSAD